MEKTTGFVNVLNFVSEEVTASGFPTACMLVGPTEDALEAFFIRFRASDSARTLGYKKSMVNLLAKAHAKGYEVTVYHPENSGDVSSISFRRYDMLPIGMAILNDFFAVSGSGIPDDAEFVFETPIVYEEDGETIRRTYVVSVPPDVVRPHWVFVAQLPSYVFPGRNTVRLESPSSDWSSDAVPIDVINEIAPATVRVLYSGSPKSHPYTIAFVANPAIEVEGFGSFYADPVLTDRLGFHRLVSICLQNLLTLTEDVLRQDDMDAHIRFISIFDSTLSAIEENSLAHEVGPNIMETRRTKLNAFLARYSEKADMVFVIHGSDVYDRASAWYTSDDVVLPGTTFTFDGESRVHGHFPGTPGSAAMPLNTSNQRIVALHEFCHGASDFINGRISDLYINSAPNLSINKKIRNMNTDPIPIDFASYNATTYPSDQTRNGIGYPGDWRTYHSALMDPTRPNVMDSADSSFDGPKNCRLDQLTYDWFSDRLRAKVFR